MYLTVFVRNMRALLITLQTTVLHITNKYNNCLKPQFQPVSLNAVVLNVFAAPATAAAIAASSVHPPSHARLRVQLQHELVALRIHHLLADIEVRQPHHLH